MMTEEQEFELQALLDGELTGAGRSAAAQCLKTNPAARELYDELEMTRGAVRGNELPRHLDCPREFYWQAIERAITSIPAGSVGGVSILGWLRVNFAAVSAATALVVLAIFSLAPERDLPLQTTVGEPLMVWETARADTGLITYKNHETGFSMIWVVDRTKEAPTE